MVDRRSPDKLPSLNTTAPRYDQSYYEQNDNFIAPNLMNQDFTGSVRMDKPYPSFPQAPISAFTPPSQLFPTNLSYLQPRAGFFNESHCWQN